MNTIKAVLSRLDKNKVELSLASEAEAMYDKLSQEVTGIASDSYPVYADDTVFAQLVDAYYEITEQILDTLSQYDLDETYQNAKTLSASGDALVQEAVDLKIKLQDQANELGVDPTTIEAYALLERGIKDAEESMKYVNSPWEEAYNKLKDISFTNL
jgi:hypothetical protein